MRSRVPTIYDDGEPIPAAWDLRCASCGYSLTGLSERRCPECGQRFNPRDIWEANHAEPDLRELTRIDHVVLGAVALVVLALFVISMLGNDVAWIGLVIIVLAEANVVYSRSDPLPMHLMALSVGVVVLIAALVF